MANERYVVVGRGKKAEPFSLYYIVPTREAGWRTGRAVEEQQELLGHKGHKCVVISEENWFEKKKMILVEPPAGFDFTIPTGVWKPDPRIDQPAFVVRHLQPAKQPVKKMTLPSTRTINPLFDIVSKKTSQVEATPELASPEEPTPPVKPASGFVPKKCPYCTSDIPSNGAAQYSHLKKHVNELVARKVLTVEQGQEIRKTKLTPEMEKVFGEAFGIMEKTLGTAVTA